MAAGPAAEERQGDDQEDSRTGRRTEEGGIPFALASRTESFFFFFAPWLRGQPGERSGGWKGRKGGKGR